MNLYESQFSDKNDFKQSNTCDKTLIIASTPRCGSHMLGHILYETGKFGFPLEYFQNKNYEEWKRLLNVKDPKKLLGKLENKRTSSNGVFGIKLHFSHLKNLGGYDEVSKIFKDPYIVFLRRRDIVKQAVSLSIANQTGVWIAGQKPISNEKPFYDYNSINRYLKRTILDNASWEYQLHKSNINFLNLFFEDFKSNIDGTTSEIAKFMNLNQQDFQNFKNLAPATKKQSDSINNEWKDRFLEERREDDLLKDMVVAKDSNPNFFEKLKHIINL